MYWSQPIWSLCITVVRRQWWQQWIQQAIAASLVDYRLSFYGLLDLCCLQLLWKWNVGVRVCECLYCIAKHCSGVKGDRCLLLWQSAVNVKDSCWLYALLIFVSCPTSHPDDVSAVLTELAAGTDHQTGVTKFNINRAHVYDGARRAILRKQFSPNSVISVKFMDDIGQSEGAVDDGGPKRELFQLLMDYFANTSPTFTGPVSCKHLNFVHSGCYCWFLEKLNVHCFAECINCMQ